MRNMWSSLQLIANSMKRRRVKEGASTLSHDSRALYAVVVVIVVLVVVVLVVVVLVTNT